MKTLMILLLVTFCSCEPKRAKDYGQQWTNKDSTNININPIIGF